MIIKYELHAFIKPTCVAVTMRTTQITDTVCWELATVLFVAVGLCIILCRPDVFCSVWQHHGRPHYIFCSMLREKYPGTVALVQSSLYPIFSVTDKNTVWNENIDFVIFKIWKVNTLPCMCVYFKQRLWWYTTTLTEFLGYPDNSW